VVSDEILVYHIEIVLLVLMTGVYVFLSLMELKKTFKNFKYITKILYTHVKNFI